MVKNRQSKDDFDYVVITISNQRYEPRKREWLWRTWILSKPKYPNTVFEGTIVKKIVINYLF